MSKKQINWRGMTIFSIVLIFSGLTAASWTRNGVPGEMSNIEFSAEVIKAIAWPAVPVLFFLLFRERIDLLLEHVTLESPNGWKFSLKINKNLDQALDKLAEGEAQRGENEGEMAAQDNEPHQDQNQEAPQAGAQPLDEQHRPERHVDQDVHATTVSDDDVSFVRKSSYDLVTGAAVSDLFSALKTWESVVQLAGEIIDSRPVLSAGPTSLQTSYKATRRPYRAPARIFSELHKFGFINTAELDALKLTNDARNKLAHAVEPNISNEAIWKFGELAQSMENLMRRIIKNTRAPGAA